MGAIAAAADSASLDELRREMEVEEQRGQWSNVVRIAREILERTERARGAGAAETADALDGLGRRLVMLGEIEEVGALYRRALSIRQAMFGDAHMETAKSYYRLGEFAKNCLRDRDQAKELLLRCLEIRERHAAEQPGVLADVLVELGWLGVISTDYAQAERYLRQVDVLVREGVAVPLLRQADALYALGWVYFGVKDYAKAHRSFERGWRLKQEGRGPEHWETMEVANAVAVTCRMLGEYGEALEISQECLRVRERIFGPHHAKTAESLAALGITCEMSGRVAEAKPLLERAVAILERSGGSESFHLADSLFHLSTVLHRLGSLEEAEAIQERAVRSLEEGARASLAAPQYRHLAQLKLDLGNQADALHHALRERRLWEELVASAFSVTSERQRLALISDGSCPDLLATLGAAVPLAEAILRTKGIVLDSLLEDCQYARIGGEDQAAAILRRLEECRRQRTALLVPGSEQASATPRVAGQARLDEEIGDLQTELARRTADRSPARRALQVSVAEVQRVIPDRASLIELLRYDHYLGPDRSEPRYGALLLARRDEPRWLSLGPAGAIERQVRLLQHSCRNPGTDGVLMESLRWLYQNVWRPIEKALPAGTLEVIVSPDGALAFVSFAALTDGLGPFVGERYRISYVSTGRDLVGIPGSDAGTGGLLVLANPDFGAPALDTGSGKERALSGAPGEEPVLRGLSFRPLPGAEAEGRLLQRRAFAMGFPGVELYTGREATETRLRRAKGAKVLHLATHGFHLPAEPGPASLESATKVAGVVDSGLGHPMLRSGLLLAGARASLERRNMGKRVVSENDGILTAHEVATLDLRGTELVVISACDSGMGELWTGEGVLGLRRGFVQAGVRNLLLTLWPIEDGEIASMMLDFHSTSQRTGDARQALAEVQRAWLSRLRAERGPAVAARVAGPLILSYQASAK